MELSGKKLVLVGGAGLIGSHTRKNPSYGGGKVFLEYWIIIIGFHRGI